MYALIKDNQVVRFPYHIADLVRENPTVSFPFPLTEEVMNKWGVHVVHETPMPSVNEYTEVVEELSPAFVDGKWTQQWTTIPLSDGEKEIKKRQREVEVRLSRNETLSQTDWSQLADSPLSAEAKQAYAVYRQALRDVTDQPGFPWEITWPNLPIV